MPTSPSDDVLLPTLTGPTGVGKTERSLRLAEQLNAEIVSVDSRQVYRRLDIGTAKPPPEVLASVPHHFIDERDLDEPFSAGSFARAANERIASILKRGHLPLLVGGSTLYIHALQYGLADIPSVPEEVRQRMQERLEEEGSDALYSELIEVDPAATERVDPTKTERLLRALEVYHHTGKPLTYYYDNQPEPPFSYKTVVLHRERPELYDRINLRVEQMLDRGLLDEVKQLLEDGVDPDTRPLRTIGYREPIRHLQGEISFEEMKRLVKRNTRRYAKRQLTWFRRYDEYRWMDANASPDELLDAFAQVEAPV